MSRCVTMLVSFAVMFGMSLLLISASGIAAGLATKHIILPVYEWATDPGALYVDDARCCR